MGNDIEETTAGGIMDPGNEEVNMGQEEEDQNPAFVQYQEDNNDR